MPQPCLNRILNAFFPHQVRPNASQWWGRLSSRRRENRYVSPLLCVLSSQKFPPESWFFVVHAGKHSLCLGPREQPRPPLRWTGLGFLVGLASLLPPCGWICLSNRSSHGMGYLCFFRGLGLRVPIIPPSAHARGGFTHGVSAYLGHLAPPTRPREGKTMTRKPIEYLKY